MKCPSCSLENKASAKACKKCGENLLLPPPWRPDWKWHARVLCCIYAGVSAVYFLVSFFLKSLPEPYSLREIPPEMTPWLRSRGK